MVPLNDYTNEVTSGATLPNFCPTMLDHWHPTGRVLLLPQQPSLLRCGIACHSRSHVSNTSYAKPTVQYHNAG